MKKELSERFKKKMGFVPTIMEIATELDPKLSTFYEFCDFTVQEDGALPSKIKMLIIMAMGAQRHCKECVISAMRGAFKKGATVEEIVETIRCIAVAGGAPAISACKDALQLLKEGKLEEEGC